jgi:primosomal protein N' (replication factor Y) (superfamily II helicase)
VTGDRVVRVLPDGPGVGKTFDYVLPARLGGEHVRVGSRVRVPLGRRRVGGWVVATDTAPPPDVELKDITKLSGLGPPGELVDLAHWAGWRWAGRAVHFLKTASPPRVVASLPAPLRDRSGPRLRPDWTPGRPHDLAGEALRAGLAVLRLPPASDPVSAALVAAWTGNVLVLCPTEATARRVARVLKAEGVPTVRHPQGWATGAAGATVVGTRAAAWAPVGDLAAVVVVDEHDESHASEGAPTWSARDVAVERARRQGVPCVLVSPCPTLEGLQDATLVAPSRSEERSGWPVVLVADRREDDPRTGLLSAQLVDAVRRSRSDGGRVVCVLNRVGRARLLACSSCGELASCTSCAAAMTQPGGEELVCPQCGLVRPVLCTVCGATRLKLLRQGVSRVREELEALVGEPVGEVTGGSASEGLDHTRVLVGTEAVLHQVERAAVVAFLDLDQELLASRYRAVEQAFGLVARAARLVGARRGEGRLLLQTRLPDHEVVRAAVAGDPALVSAAEAERRELLAFPPATALAEISGPAAPTMVELVREVPGLAVSGPADGRWLVRAPDHRQLCDGLASVRRPSGRLRVAVDPLRV